MSTPQGEYLKTFGVADKQSGQKMETSMHMRIGSETKTFTVTAILQLVDMGKLKLDDPISKYISGVPGGSKISIRQLAEMRSGLPSYTTSTEWANKFLANPLAPWTPEQLLPYGYKLPALFAPGAEFNYSNSNLVLLGLVVEKLSGQPVQDFIQQHILDPLKMTHTVLPTDATFASPHAQGYTTQTASGKEEIATNWNPSWAWAAGAMISDASDLKIWAKAMATGVLLKPATQVQRLKVLPFKGDPADEGYGLGLLNLHGWIGHNGSLPGYESVTVYNPALQATVVVLINTDEGASLDDGKTYYEPSTLVAKGITGVISPGHIYDIPPSPAN